jgi:threonine aldolase
MPINRRDFLKTSTLTVLPGAIPGLYASKAIAGSPQKQAAEPIVKFYGDSDRMDTVTFLSRLQESGKKINIERDSYGQGGSVSALEKRFAAITGKEKAIFLPSGTLANQLAISVLSGTNTKVFVQDTSHVYRDEADAAQSIFQKRLMPLAKDACFFTVSELKAAVDDLKYQEVFESGIGAVSIENPVRRSDGRIVPIDEIKKISDYCRSAGFKLHLDGARIYLAAAWSGVSIKQYASHFDTVYISLYKYLGANAGAILCGEKAIIDKMPHLMKIHGASMYSNWPNAAMALLEMDEIENRLLSVKNAATALFTLLNKIPGIQVNTFPDGTNMYLLKLGASVNGNIFQEMIEKTYNIRIPPPNKANETILTVNETLMQRDAGFIVAAFKNTIAKSSL